MMEQSEYPQFGYNLKREDTMEFLKSALDKTCRQPVLSDISFAFMLFFRFQIAFGFSHFFSTMWNNEFTVEIFVILFFSNSVPNIDSSRLSILAQVIILVFMKFVATTECHSKR